MNNADFGKVIKKILMAMQPTTPIHEAWAIAMMNGYPPKMDGDKMSPRDPFPGTYEDAVAGARSIDPHMLLASLMTPQFWEALGKGMGWDSAGMLPEAQRRQIAFVNHTWHQRQSDPQNAGMPQSYFKEILTEWRAKQKADAEARGS